MRVLATADLHYNHPGSRPVADRLIDEMNGVAADVLLIVGDTAVADGDALERCLSRFTFGGPKLFVAGNHELWTHRDDSYELFHRELPVRIRALGWHWLETEPFVDGELAIVGTVGWYDYRFAEPSLKIPRRFYEHKISPGAATRFSEFKHLFDPALEPIDPSAVQIVARWNDGRHVKLHRSDEAFADELLDKLTGQLEEVRRVRVVLAAIHQLPFKELLPPRHGGQWDFVKAYLGSPRIGEVLLRYKNIRYCLSGHSHYPATATIGHIHAINIGSSRRGMRYQLLRIDP